MMNILDIIYDYSKNGKLLDEHAIVRILGELFKVNSITDYTFDVLPKNNHILDRTLTGNTDDSEINIYLNTMYKKINKGVYKSELAIENKLVDFELILRQNLDMLFTCFHEVEHAIQYKTMKESNIDDTNEKKLLRLEYYYIELSNKMIEYDSIMDRIIRYIPSHIEFFSRARTYIHNYYISYMERLADINATQKIQALLKSIKEETPLLVELMDQMLLYTQMQSYSSMWSPTLLFFDNLGLYKECYQFETMDYPYEERIRLGLNLTEEEYESNNEQVLKMKANN